MVNDLKSILLLMAVSFLVCPLMGMSDLAAQEPSFHCSLGLHGQALAEAELNLSKDGSALHYKLEVNGVEDITMAHLHLGKPGQIGTPVVWLYPSGPPPKLISGLFKGTLAQGTITKKDLRGPLRGKSLTVLIAEIKAGNVYVNIHTEEHAKGDICGPVYLVKQ